MNAAASSVGKASPQCGELELGVAALCRLDAAIVERVREGRDLWKIGGCAAALTLVGGALYGFVFGLWRAPEQGLYAALKLPLLLFAIVLGSACINGFLALLLRARMGVSQGLVAILLSLAMAAVLLGALSPVSLLFVLSVPGPDQANVSDYELYQTAELVLFLHIVVIGLCGIAGNVRLYRLLRELVPTRAIAHRVMASWLIVDGVLGTQLSWVLRPFLCKPNLEPELLRHDALDGNFFEELSRILGPAGAWALALVCGFGALGFWVHARFARGQADEGAPAGKGGPYRSAPGSPARTGST